MSSFRRPHVRELGHRGLRRVAAREDLREVHLGHAAGRVPRVVVALGVDDQRLQHLLDLARDLEPQRVELPVLDVGGDVVVGVEAAARLADALPDAVRDGRATVDSLAAGAGRLRPHPGLTCHGRCSPREEPSTPHGAPRRPSASGHGCSLRLVATRRVQDQHLRVAPEMLGLALASPSRRIAAIVLDGVLLVLPTVAVALTAAALSLRASDRAAYDGLSVLLPGRSATASATHDALRAAGAAARAPGGPWTASAAALAVEEGRLDEAADLLSTRHLEFALRLDESGESPLAPGHVRVPIEKLIPAGGGGFERWPSSASRRSTSRSLTSLLGSDDRQAPGGSPRPPPRRRTALVRRVVRAVHRLPAHPGPSRLAGPRPLA